MPDSGRSLDGTSDSPQFRGMKDHLGWIKDMLGATGSPEEENAALLRRMAEDGDDLGVSRDIDFNHVFPTEALAIAFENEVRARGYQNCDRDFSVEQEGWLTSVTVRMTPDLAGITATELALNDIAMPLEGKSDGWGCMEMVPAEP